MPAITPNDLPPRDLHGVDVWLDHCVRLSRDDRAACAELLDEGERARHDQLVRERDRDAYLVAHRLRREALSHYVDVEPHEWRFQTEADGRPHTSQSAPRFSLSHTAGLAICAVGVGSMLGADVEDITQEVELDAVAATAMSPAERDELRGLATEARARAFFQRWTLKEAYAKARGLGLALPFDRLHFECADPIRLRCGADLEPDCAAWRFALIDLGAHHVAAVAVRGLDAAAPIRVVACADRSASRAADPTAAR